MSSVGVGALMSSSSPSVGLGKPLPLGRRLGGHLSEEPWLSLPQISGQLSPRLFRKLPPRVCVSLKNIVDEDFLYAG